jgi:2'-hydroxyisoflavone reductase
MPTRRQMLELAAASSLSTALPSALLDGAHAQTAMAGTSVSPNVTKAAKSLNILILGGTGFTGPHQVRYALARGHKITLFNRGRRPREWPEAVEELTGDREVNDYASLKGRKWDVCIDNPTSVPAWVRDAAAVLKGNVGHYTFISTLSVYAGNAQLGADETVAREKYNGADAMAETNATLRKNMALFGPLKALCEDEAIKQFGAGALIIRPGLIVGPGDETDRFSYWPVRLSRGGDVLVPPAADPVQFIDARDLAEWTIRQVEAKASGAFNAMGPKQELSMGAMLKTINEAAGNKAVLREASMAFLSENKVAPWGDLPVWVPGQGQTAGFARRSNKKALDAGLTFRPLSQTAADTLAWWQSLPEARRATLRAGLKAEREAELLAKLKAAA